jgi:hypothetical protein
VVLHFFKKIKKRQFSFQKRKIFITNFWHKRNIFQNFSFFSCVWQFFSTFKNENFHLKFGKKLSNYFYFPWCYGHFSNFKNENFHFSFQNVVFQKKSFQILLAP